MRFSTATIFFGLAASTLAAPTMNLSKRGVLSASSYSDFQISDGQGGNALEEVNQKFPVSLHDIIENPKQTEHAL